MKYVRFGKTSWDISAAGVGVMQESSAPARAKGPYPDSYINALRRAVELGVNYIDLGYPELYPDHAERAEVIRGALGLGRGERLKVNINLPARGAATAGELDRLLSGQLSLWGLDRADLCTIHCLDRGYREAISPPELERWAGRAAADGRVGYLGFSFHDDAHYLEEILPLCSRWSFVRFEYSLADYRHHPGVGGLELARKNGCAVMVSEPLKGGRLLLPAHQNVEAAWDRARAGRSRLEYALSWVYNDPCVSTVQFELASPEQAEEYIGAALGCEAGSLDSFDILWGNKVREEYYKRRYFKCTSCRCCMPCPLGIDAPGIIELYNDSLMFQERDIPGLYYRLKAHDRIRCVNCGTCVRACPKHYPITELLALAGESFG